MQILYLKMYMHLYLDRQELYEKETNYGVDKQKQSEWRTTINNELNDLSSYSK